jgi:hypothetical protein
MKRWSAGLLLCALALRCATGEDDPVRNKPGGYAGTDGGGSGGASGSSGKGGSAGGGTAGGGASDAGLDVDLDAASDALDGGAGSAGAAGDAAADVVEAGPGGRLLLVARSDTQLTFGETTGATWSVQNVPRATLSTPALVASPWGALALFRDSAGNALSWSAWEPSSSGWSAPAAVASGGMTIASPALAAAASDVQLAFLGTDNKLYANVYAPGSGWQNTFTNVQAGSVHSFGPSAPALVASNAAVTLAQEGQDGDLHTQLWQGGWQPGYAHGLAPKLQSLTPPAATFRHGTGKAIVAYVETGTARLMWTEGWADGWSAPIAVHPQAISPSTPALAALPNGQVVLGYRAPDDNVYASVMSGGSFGQPVLVHPSLGTSSSPAIAPGVGGQIAEMVWVSGNSIQHSSLGANGWSGPTAVAAGGHKAVALATWMP